MGTESEVDNEVIANTTPNIGGPLEVTPGDQDPLSPRNMPLVRKWLIMMMICMGTVCVTCASAAYAATYDQMDAELGSSRLVSTVGLSVFVLGIASGPLVTSPMSEWYGRRPVYLVSWTLFIIWMIPTAAATNIQTIIISRFFTGCAGGTFLAVAGGTARDLFPSHELQNPMALVASAPFIGPSTGPLLGGFINSYADWRWTHYVMIIWAVCLLVLIAIFAPETHHQIRKSAMAKRRHKEIGNSHDVSTDQSPKSKGQMLMISLLRPFQLLSLEPMCLCLSLYSAILLGILYLFFSAFPLMFETNHTMNAWQGGLTFLGIIIGMLVAAATTPIWSRVRQRLINSSKGLEDNPPEYRLPPAILGGFFTPIGLFWFAWTIYPSIHWMVPVVGSAIFGFGTLLTFMGIFTYLVDAYSQYAASALAANGLARCSFAAAFPLFGMQMYEALGYQWATSLLAFLTVAMLPFPWIFFVYGATLRKKSRFAVQV